MMINQVILWFGAAVSISEIITGALIMPLGMKNGVLAIIIGHILGGIIFYLSGMIGAYTKKSSMESAKSTFGDKGALVFSGLNILQLVGWTAVMISIGATAANSIYKIGDGTSWSYIMATAIFVWIMIKDSSNGKFNFIVGVILFLLTVYLSKTIFFSKSIETLQGNMDFGTAVELSVIMPLSWLPLIGDYIHNTSNPKKAALLSSISYFVASSWMYIIGLGMALYIGETDFNSFIVKAGFGVIGVLIIILSTVTTTFLDVYSAGVSALLFFPKASVKKIGGIVCIVALILLLLFGIDKYEEFLYLISSVFAPMIAIQIVNNLILKKDHSNKMINYTNMIIWVIGVLLYREAMNYNSFLGYSIPLIMLLIVLVLAVDKVSAIVKSIALGVAK